MKILETLKSRPTQDGAGVKISRVHDFSGLKLDPFLMVDELKSEDVNDFIGGFPPHPHRGIETFTYMIKGGFEHRDQLGNRKVISSGDVQWMSTGYGVVHSEMPVVDENTGMHGFQIWINMPAKDKLRPARYQDTAETGLPILENSAGASLRLLAGEWEFGGEKATSPLNDLAGSAAIADLRLGAKAQATLSLAQHEQAFLYIHTGELGDNSEYKTGTLLLLDPKEAVNLVGGENGAGVLVFGGQKIKEKIAHHGPFVMNTPEEIEEAIRDYQAGKFGAIA